MIKTLLLLFCCVGMSQGVTLDVVRIYQPLSLHGTDSAEEDKNGDAVQAAIYSRPMALSGAFPEELVSSVGHPFRMVGTPPYKVKECNLLALCHISVHAVMKNDVLWVMMDVSEMSIPKKVRLQARAIVDLSIKAVQKTLWAYPMAEGEKQKCKIVITGTDEKNRGLATAGKEFTLGQ